MTAHAGSAVCQGETCRFDGCTAAATHKLLEELGQNDPIPKRQTSFVCCVHFRAIFGAGVECTLPDRVQEPVAGTTRVQRRLNFAAQVCRERGWTLGVLTPFQLKELRRLQDEEPPSGTMPLNRPSARRDV